METTTRKAKRTIQSSTQHVLSESVQVLTGVGTHLGQLLGKLKITTIHELLLHLPYKYQDRTRVTAINDLQVNTHAVIQVKVHDFKITPSRTKQKVLSLYAHDASGVIELKFFHFNSAQLNTFKSQPVLRCFGEIRFGKTCLMIMHPEYDVINEQFVNQVEDNLRPIYPSTEGISQKKWQALINAALLYVSKNQNIREYLPQAVASNQQLMSFLAAIQFIHRPPPDISINLLESRQHPAQQRLIFEELLAQQLAMELHRKERLQFQGLACPNKDLAAKLLEIIAFKLTNAQLKVFNEIAADLSKNLPMNRLLQGDVGAGKTIIAALAIVQAVASGYQVALMAPTEILAEQHYNNLNRYFNLLGINSELLIAKLTKKKKQQIKQSLSDNSLAIVIGTHAIIQEDVVFKSLGLAIIDEQHRFGVEQRHALLQKGSFDGIMPHQLTMTATPIPRTLAMTIYADMDYSVIDELPPGRKVIKTVVISDQKQDEVINRIKVLVAQGRQVYWVCTLIEESEILTCQAAEERFLYLKQQLKDLSIGLIHGRMKSEEKSQIMQDFKNNQIQILVATTVIEVGVDVANASLMIIENPERLGLSQLHQLRGRVGRGEYESYCVLLYKSPLSHNAESRLGIMRDTSDGFKLADHDLKLRGAGELLGKKQTGAWNLKIADLIKDRAVITEVRKSAKYIAKHHPEIVPELIKLWLGDNYKLAVV